MTKIIKDYYDIVILPDQEVSGNLIELSDEISKTTPIVAGLGKIVNRPHISILHIAIKPEKLKIIENRLRDFTKKTKPFIVTLSGFETVGNVLFLRALPKSKFNSLLNSILSLIDDLADNEFDYKQIWRYDEKPPQLQKHIDKFRTPFVKKAFVPHVTVTHFSDPKLAKNAIKKVKFIKEKFIANSLSLCKLGEHHTCQKIIFETDFNKG